PIKSVLDCDMVDLRVFWVDVATSSGMGFGKLTRVTSGVNLPPLEVIMSSLCIWTATGHGFFGAQGPVEALWHHALFHRRLGGLRAACRGRAAHGGEGQHPKDREQAH